MAPASTVDAQLEETSVCQQEQIENGDKSQSATELRGGSARGRGVRFALLLLCLFLGNFLVGYVRPSPGSGRMLSSGPNRDGPALIVLKDSSCIGTLTPVITDQFHSLSDLGWYQTAYLVALCVPMLIYGQLYTLYSMKTLYMASFSIFAIGSVLTAAAPSSVSFILGRAFSGLGAAGINSGISIIIANTIPLERRPIIFGICGALECAALAFGPLISGTIAHYTTWRASFYIIVPMGVAVVATVFFSIGHIRQSENAQLTKMERLQRIDWAGLATELPMTVCLVLGLQWARTLYPWSDWRIVLLLTAAGALLMGFVVAESRARDNCMVSLKSLRQRTVAFASLIAFCNFAALWAVSFYLPLYFQAVRGASTLRSGLMYLPLAGAMSVSALAGGPLTTSVGSYSPVLAIGSVLAVIGTALISTLQPHSPAGQWISYQIIYGAGIGLAFQPPFLAVQTVLENPVVPAALVLLNFVQILGGIIVLSIAQNVFLAKLVSYLATAVPQLDSTTALNNGALGLVNSVSGAQRDQVLAAYSRALGDVFHISLGLSCLAVVSTLGLEWRRIRQDANKAAGSA